MCETKDIPSISIIVPVYNVEAYLKQCIDSLVNQTYSNLEIILVDDGSEDLSSKMCDDYAKDDKRIIVIHKENGGPSSARKAGIDAATGQYVMIVDGDDWIEKDTCERCMEVALRNHSDCVLFAYVREHSHKSIPNPLFERDFFYDKGEAEQKIHRRLIGMSDKDLCHPEKIDNFSSVCMKLYRLEVAKKGKIISEKIVGTSEDTIFNIYALYDCSVSYINKCFYHYRKTNMQSITSRYKKGLPEKWDVLYQIFEEYLNDIGEREQYNHFFLNRVACGMIGLGLNEISSGASVKEQVLRIREILKKPLYRKAFLQLNTKYCPLHWKIFFWLCKRRLACVLTCLLKIINYLRYKSIV